ncbi:hypothetical protein Hanom_Chr05g00457221 [Helianthus anomalus]
MGYWRNSPHRDTLAFRTGENPHLGPKPVIPVSFTSCILSFFFPFFMIRGVFLIAQRSVIFLLLVK